MTGEDLFFELIQVAIGARNSLNRVPDADGWKALYKLAVKQSLVGMAFSGLERLNALDATVKPPMPIFYEWLCSVAQIERTNQKLNQAAGQLTEIFKSGDLRSCVLKGQGLARLYPAPLRRQPGDIDLWVEGGRECVLKFLKEKFPDIGNVVIHHVDAHIIEGVETEIHFMPIWMYNPFHNFRLQKFFKDKEEEQFIHLDEEAGFCYPTPVFNGVYILVHIYHHLLDEGVGLRQIVDYYFVLKQLTLEERKEVYSIVKKIGCGRFAAALMYVMSKVCALNEELMLCSPDAKAGEAMLEEIMQTGNFGQFDERVKKQPNESAWQRNERKFRRQWQFVRCYPSEVLCIPFWKQWHWCWRRWKGFA